MPTRSPATDTHTAPTARQTRLDLPVIPQHIVQRGNNRLPCFLDDADRARYLQLLREALESRPARALSAK
jgi:putative transposase